MKAYTHSKWVLDGFSHDNKSMLYFGVHAKELYGKYRA